MNLESQEAKPSVPREDDPRYVLDALLMTHDAVVLASTGGPYSPWLLGAYFVHEGPHLFLFLEREGKTRANLAENASVALLVSDNDATKDFVQARGTVRLLDDAQEPVVRQKLLAKMPWYATYTPVVPVCIEITEAFVSSLGRGWFPAKRIGFEAALTPLPQPPP